jgi:hypothetical protein
MPVKLIFDQQDEETSGERVRVGVVDWQRRDDPALVEGVAEMDRARRRFEPEPGLGRVPYSDEFALLEDLVDVRDLAERFGVRETRIRRWTRRADFPRRSRDSDGSPSTAGQPSCDGLDKLHAYRFPAWRAWQAHDDIPCEERPLGEPGPSLPIDRSPRRTSPALWIIAASSASDDRVAPA